MLTGFSCLAEARWQRPDEARHLKARARRYGRADLKLLAAGRLLGDMPARWSRLREASIRGDRWELDIALFQTQDPHPNKHRRPRRSTPVMAPPDRPPHTNRKLMAGLVIASQLLRSYAHRSFTSYGRPCAGAPSRIEPRLASWPLGHGVAQVAQGAQDNLLTSCPHSAPFELHRAVWCGADPIAVVGSTRDAWGSSTATVCPGVAISGCRPHGSQALTDLSL